ncbi:hypothetical protein J0A67_01865 [Algoriphagus aestuariicola]|uniref:Uncharacterized protein n=1 Tax=Algoriphagus aestuariicola TaxID=1852016 RepID=A0ABS3BJV7_9BACT|nr:hypothetical protein [Algoriphagus aestuariicola]MBN7799585.1 hypothetical protein [Algoriphagus aestuariicola]
MKERKNILPSLLLLFASIQCMFVGTIIFERANYLEVGTFTLIFVLILASHFQTYVCMKLRFEFDRWSVAIWVFFGSFATFGLRQFGVETVLATALVGLFGALLQTAFKSNSNFRQVPSAIYCGAFISMTNLTNDPGFILLASVFTCLLFFASKSILQGIGGRLGTMAFIGVVFAYFVQQSVDLI